MRRPFWFLCRLRACVAVLSIVAAGPVAAQTTAVETETAPGAVLRALDKVAGRSHDITLAAGETAMIGRLALRLEECRYPAANPQSNAYAYLDIRDERDGHTLFAGWMIADSPALNALEHARYDVWVLRCSNS